ncbi:COP9 signalosome (CSN) subunit [Irineochytrium annulatum]|nr:COP9 signalosome (CSN) subunit [Irineochytrium annulatum]
MGKRSIKAYIEDVSGNLAQERGDELGELLRLGSDAALEDAIAGQNAVSWENQVRRLDGVWADIALGHLKVVKAVLNGDYATAFADQNLAAQSARQFHQVATNMPRWVLPVLYTLNLDLRKLAILADQQLRDSGQKALSLEEAARTMNKAFSVCATDRYSTLERSRKWGAFFVCNLLFQTYFRLKQINLASTLIRSLTSADLPDLELYPIAHVVTFKYYMGVLAFFNEQYDKRCRARGPYEDIYVNNRRYSFGGDYI